jgi:hypothetical protein
VLRRVRDRELTELGRGFIDHQNRIHDEAAPQTSRNPRLASQSDRDNVVAECPQFLGN